MVKYGCSSSSSPRSYTGTIAGCSRRPCTRASATNRAREVGCGPCPERRRLMATRRPIRQSTPQPHLSHAPAAEHAFVVIAAIVAGGGGLVVPSHRERSRDRLHQPGRGPGRGPRRTLGLVHLARHDARLRARASVREEGGRRGPEVRARPRVISSTGGGARGRAGEGTLVGEIPPWSAISSSACSVRAGWESFYRASIPSSTVRSPSKVVARARTARLRCRPAFFGRPGASPSSATPTWSRCTTSPSATAVRCSWPWSSSRGRPSPSGWRPSSGRPPRYWRCSVTPPRA